MSVVSAPLPTVPGESARPQPRRHSAWIPTAAVAAVIVFVVFGGYVVGGALSTQTGPPVLVGGVVTIHPLSGWQVTHQGQMNTGADFAELSRGTGTLDTIVSQTSLSSVDLLRAYVSEFLRPAASQLSVSQDIRPVRLNNGLIGVRASYVGTFGARHAQIEGEVTTLVTANGSGIVWDGWGPAGLYPYARGDIDGMIRTAGVA